MIKRLSGLDLAVSNLDAAVETLQRNFGLKLCRMSGDTEVTLTLGGTAIRLIAAPQAAAGTAPGSEGMVGLWLEARDVEAVAASLARAGFAHAPLKIARSRRVLEIAPPGFAAPWLFIFDRRA